jgi:hypothetical protein
MCEIKPRQPDRVANPQQKEEIFFTLIDQFRSTSDPEQAKQSGDHVGRILFGE